MPDSSPASLSAAVRQRVLDDAADCVLRDRNETYGEPEDSFSDIAKGWSVIAGAEISATEVCLMMAWLKTVRAKNNPARADSFVDAIGYFACSAACAEIAKKG